MTLIPPTPADYAAAIAERRQHQESLGYDAAHDDKEGIAHLLNWAIDYNRRGRNLDASALMSAAVDVHKRAAGIADGLRPAVRGYVANLRSIAEQLTDVVDQIEAVSGRKPGAETAIQEAREGIRFYGLIADDLDKILRGEQLEQFAITGTIKPSGGAQ